MKRKSEHFNCHALEYVRNVLFGCSAIILLLLYSFTNGYAGSKRIALVIGNSAYKDSPLANPKNDARLIASILRTLDFRVIEHLDADQHTMKRALQKFGDHLDEAGRDATGLFYYAGHGVQVKGENYLIPVNAAIQRERDVEIEAVNAAAVMGVLDYARTKINFVIIDACRNNPFARSFRSVNLGLARMEAPQGTLVAYATAPGNVAFDGEGKHSPYSEALAEAMQQANVPVEQMFKSVRRRVMAVTENNQVPWESSSLTGNFFFKKAKEEQIAAILPAPQDVDKESLFWHTITQSKNPEDYEEYIRQFPEGTFVRLAQNRIASLTGAVKEPEKMKTKDKKQQVSTQKPVATDKSVEMSPAKKQGEAGVMLSGVTTEEREPNNSIGTGNYTSSNGVVRGRITPRGDADWFAISVKQQGELKVQVSQVAPEMDYVFRVWDNEYRTITPWIAPLRKGAVTSGNVDLPAPGYYFLELRDSRDDAASTQSYQLSLQFSGTNDRFEPNNNFGMAVPLTPGWEFQSTILPRGDADWYRLLFDRHGELQVVVRNVPKTLDISMRVWNGDKRTLTGWYGPLRPGGDTEATIDIPEPGLYMLEVRDGRDDARSVVSFSTRVSFIPSKDSFEPNNSFGRASPLAIGETVKATILPKADADWYRIDVDEQGELMIFVSEVPEELDISFRLWNADVQTMTGWHAPLKAGGNTEATIDLPSRGSYLLEVRDGRDDGRSVSPYALRTSFTPTNDRGELNNSYGTAVPLKLGAVIDGTILPRGDADWYRVSARNPGNLVVHITGSSSNLDMVFRVWNIEKRTVSGWISPLRAGGETTGEVAIQSGGSYFLEVRDGKDDARSVTPYRIRAVMKN